MALLKNPTTVVSEVDLYLSDTNGNAQRLTAHTPTLVRHDTLLTQAITRGCQVKGSGIPASVKRDALTTPNVDIDAMLTGEDDEDAEVEEDSRPSLIMNAVRGVIEDDDPDLLTSSGKPKTDVIEARTGLDSVSAAERDAAFATL